MLRSVPVYLLTLSRSLVALIACSPATQASYLAGIHGPADSSQGNLTLHWTFDQPGLVRGAAVSDVSGNGNDATVGHMPTIKDEMTFGTGLPNQV